MKVKHYSLIVALLAFLTLGPISYASDQIDISDIQITSISSGDSLNQCALVLDFQFPTQIDSSEIIFAELKAGISYQLLDDLPMALACASILPDQQLENLTFDYLKDNLHLLIDRSAISTVTLGETSGDTAFFDVSGIFRNWVQNSWTFNGLLIIPLDGHSILYGIDPEEPLLEIEIDYIEPDVD